MTRRLPPPRIALALAGGGPLGAIYEIGALCALEESLIGLELNRLSHYVGVSAGGFIAAGLANGISARQLSAAFIENTPQDVDAFDPSWLMKPAFDEFLRRGIMWPGLLVSAAWQLTVGRKSLTRVLEHLGSGLPTGVFSNRSIDTQLAALFSRDGFTNDFRKLKTRLTLVATNLEPPQPGLQPDLFPFFAMGVDAIFTDRLDLFSGYKLTPSIGRP